MPNLEEQSESNRMNQHNPEDIVISGISGHFAESKNIEELREKLFDGVDLVTADDRRWPKGLWGIPERMGKLVNLDKFDATFFGINAKQAHLMDPQSRMLLETTYECIIDAGYNPTEIRGSRTGVFIGVSESESNHLLLQDVDSINGYITTGCHRAMFPNRISYTFDFKGPSCAVDTACSSSLYAMHQAVIALRNGICDSAIVGGVNIILKPAISLSLFRHGMLAPDGACKAFDSTGSGYVRAEAVSTIFLQKVRDARRVYATVVNIRTNVDGYKSEGITFPNGKMQNQLMREVYDECGVDPVDVAYVEAHGTGTKIGDPQEINALVEIFCKDRTEPLLIGSVKSNLGHAEPASGLCSIAKVLIAMESGMIPGNLHFNNPNPEITALFDGSIKVVDCPTPLNGGLVAINNFGFGGTNAHLILRSNPKPKISQQLFNQLPNIVAVSGRTELAVNKMLDKIKVHEDDQELLAIVRDIHSNNINGHGYRGYEILNHIATVREIGETSPVKRPIWYIFSGMGSQWAGMGKALLSIDIFNQSLKRSADVLKTKGFDLMKLITNSTSEDFENVMNSSTSIIAIQMAFADVLKAIGIEPDGMIGHSIGELGCAYADGTLTAEQTILAAFYRGKCIKDANLPNGRMAAVGLSWEEAHKRCPPGVYPACHNSADSVTVSGDPDSVLKFVEDLTSEGIFAKLVNSSNVAFHSKYIEKACKILCIELQKIIPTPKKRSSRWISTSIVESHWHIQLAQTGSTDYHINNMLSPVLFQEALQHVPENAIVIEIAPHSLLQAILRRSLPPTTMTIGLQKANHADNMSHFMTNMGKLYVAGTQPKFSALYHSVQYPVGRGTPMLSPFVDWNHSESWTVAKYNDKLNAGENYIDIDISKEKYAYIADHVIDGRVLFPGTGYLLLVWKTFAKMHNTDFERLPIVMEKVHFRQATVMPKKGPVKFLVNISEGSGNFEISEGRNLKMTGRIRIAGNIEKERTQLPVSDEPEKIPLKKSDIYIDFNLRGYDYKGCFKSILSSNYEFTNGEVEWIHDLTENSFVPFIDALFQFYITSNKTSDLYLISRFDKISIDPELHKQSVANIPKGRGLLVNRYPNLNIIKSGGIKIKGINTLYAPRKQQQAKPRLEKYVFVPYLNFHPLDSDPDKARLNAFEVFLQIIHENVTVNRIKAIEFADNMPPGSTLLSPLVSDVIKNKTILTANLRVLTSFPEIYKPILESKKIEILPRANHKNDIGKDLHLVMATDIISNRDFNLLNELAASIQPSGFIILDESNDLYQNCVENKGLILVSKQMAGNRHYILIKKREQLSIPTIIRIEEDNFKWLEKCKTTLKSSRGNGQTIVFVSQNDKLQGIVGLMNCIRKEHGRSNARYIFIQDEEVVTFSMKASFYTNQINQQLTANIFKNGKWGSFRHLSLNEQNEVPSKLVEHAHITTTVVGDLSSTKWIESRLRYYRPTRGEDDQMCHVYYSALNFRDIMLATGRLSPDATYGNDHNSETSMIGIEFAGRDSQGKRVMGMLPAMGLATTVLADPELLWPVPDEWTLEEAATIPVCYGTAYLALFIRGQLKPDESVLIHSGTGGVGLASINIALHAGCKVFTTVGSQHKRDFLKKTFPQLSDRCIGNSRDTSFEQVILTETNGRGVDLVLNSLAGEQLEAGLNCLAHGGRFLEIGKYDLSKNVPLGMSIFLKDISFHGILLDAYSCGYVSASKKAELWNMLWEGIQSGAVKPLPVTVFPDNEIEQSLRYLSTGKHMGKVLMKVRDEEPEKICKPNARKIKAISKIYFDPAKSYILAGGLGGFGIELTNWIISRGARNVVLSSRAGVKTGYQAVCIKRWHANGINVVVSTTDVACTFGAEQLIATAENLAPVGGIFNLAAVLRDALIENLTEKEFKEIAAPKVNGTRNLDFISRRKCLELDHFVVFSSIACGRGSIGQSNYGWANSIMERIVEQRQTDKLPGLAIQWGPIGNVGMILEMNWDNDNGTYGCLPQRMHSCLTSMDLLLQQPHPVVASHVLAEKENHGHSIEKTTLVDSVAKVLGIKDAKMVNNKQTLTELGMDSLMSTEIKQILERNFNQVITTRDIRDLTFEKLMEMSTVSTDEATETVNPTFINAEEWRLQYVGDEIVPEKTLIRMESSSATGSPIFVVHAMDGTVSTLNTLTKELNCPVWGLQCTPEAPAESISKLATYYINEIKSVQSTGPYTIIGYSYGAIIGHEMGAQLENACESVELFYIDGSPDFTKYYIKSIVDRKSLIKPANVDDTYHIFRVSLAFLAGRINPNATFLETYDVLKNIQSDEKVLNKMVNVIGKTVFTAEDLKLAAQLFFIKLRTIYHHVPSVKFNGPVTLFKATDGVSILDGDYGLSKICTQNVIVHELKGDHRTIVIESASEIANIIHHIQHIKLANILVTSGRESMGSHE